MRFILMAALLLPCAAAFPAFERQPAGCAAVAMGGAALAAPSTWSILGNPALLPRLTAATAALFHVPGAYGLPELRRSAVAGTVQLPGGTLGAAGSVYGFDLYRETTAALAWAMDVTGDVAAGVTLLYHHLSIEGYGTAGVPGVDVGVAVQLTPDILWGMSVRNINAAEIGESGERLPRSLGLGASYRPVQEVMLAADLVKDVRYPWEVRIGISYTPVEVLAVRVGTCSEPATLHAEAGLRWSGFGFDYAYTHHPELGGVHHVGLSFGAGGGP